MAQLLCNHQVQALQLNHNRNVISTHVLITRGIHCSMATPRNWHCLGCRDHDDLQIRKRIIDLNYRSGVQKSIIATEAVDKIRSSVWIMDIDCRYVGGRYWLSMYRCIECWYRLSMYIDTSTIDVDVDHQYKRQAFSSPFSTGQTFLEGQRNKGSSRTP